MGLHSYLPNALRVMYVGKLITLPPHKSPRHLLSIGDATLRIVLQVLPDQMSSSRNQVLRN